MNRLKFLFYLTIFATLFFSVSTYANSRISKYSTKHLTSPHLMLTSGHHYGAGDIAVTSDGKYFISGGSDGSLILWDIASGKEIRRFYGHKDYITSTSITSDNKFLLSSSNDRTVRLWNIETGEAKLVISENNLFIIRAQISSNGKYICISTIDSAVRIYDGATGNLLHKLDFDGFIERLAISPDNNRLLLAKGNGHQILVYDIRTGKEINRFTVSSAGIKQILVSHDNGKIITFNKDQTVHILNSLNGIELKQFNVDKTATGLFISPDGNYSLSNNNDFKADLYSNSSGIMLRRFTAPEGARPIGFSSDNSMVFTGNLDVMIKLWDIKSGNEIRTYTGIGSLVNDVGFNKDGSYMMISTRKSRVLYYSFGDNLITVWDLKSGSILNRTSNPDIYGISLVSFAKNSPSYISINSAGKIAVWDLVAGFIKYIQYDHFNYIHSIAVSPNNKYVAIGQDDEILLFDISNGKLLRSFTGINGAVMALAFSSDEKYLLSGSHNKGHSTIRMWDILTGDQLQQHLEGEHNIFAVAFSPDDKYFLTNNDETACLWDTSSGNKIRQFKGHIKYITSVAFSHDGKFILIGSEDSTASLWDAETGKEICVYNGHQSAVFSVAFSPDDKYVLTGGADCCARLWMTATGKELVDLYTFKDGSWLAMTPDERYDGDPIGISQLYYVANQTILPIPPNDRHRVPNLLSKVLNSNTPLVKGIDTQALQITIVQAVVKSSGTEELGLSDCIEKSLCDLTNGANDSNVTYVPDGALDGAIQPRCKYTVKGDKVKVTLYLIKDGKSIYNTTLAGTKSNLDALGLKIADTIVKKSR